MRPIDADALQESMNAVVFRNVPVEHQPYIQAACEMYVRLLNAAPTEDAVKVVRCLDCNNYTRSPFGHSFIGWCKLDGKHRRQNFYCADGERKADND